MNIDNIITLIKDTPLQAGGRNLQPRYIAIALWVAGKVKHQIHSSMLQFNHAWEMAYRKDAELILKQLSTRCFIDTEYVLTNVRLMLNNDVLAGRALNYVLYELCESYLNLAQDKKYQDMDFVDPKLMKTLAKAESIDNSAILAPIITTVLGDNTPSSDEELYAMLPMAADAADNVNHLRSIYREAMLSSNAYVEDDLSFSQREVINTIATILLDRGLQSMITHYLCVASNDPLINIQVLKTLTKRAKRDGDAVTVPEPIIDAVLAINKHVSNTSTTTNNADASVNTPMLLGYAGR